MSRRWSRSHTSLPRRGGSVRPGRPFRRQRRRSRGRSARSLEDTFGCPVFDRYGCREVLNIAHECEAHSRAAHLHGSFSSSRCWTATARPPRGTPGRVVVTSLEKLTRCRSSATRSGTWRVLADREFSCGRPFPLLARVEGRVTRPHRVALGADPAGRVSSRGSSTPNQGVRASRWCRTARTA